MYSDTPSPRSLTMPVGVFPGTPLWRRARRRHDALLQARRIVDLIANFVVAVIVFTGLCCSNDDGLEVLVRLWLTIGGCYGAACYWETHCDSRLHRLTHSLDSAVGKDCP